MRPTLPPPEGWAAHEPNSSTSSSADISLSSALHPGNVSNAAVVVVPPFKLKEIVFGPTVGSGGFCIVRDIKAFHLEDPSDSSFSGRSATIPLSEKRQQLALREQMSATCIVSGEELNCDTSMAPSMSENQKMGRRRSNHFYVVKSLRTDLVGDERSKGIADLAIEAKFLGSLSHENIISLRGVSDVDPLDTSGRFFVILDKLVCTLEQQWKSWRIQVGKCKGIPPCGCCGNKLRLKELWVDRLKAARDIACAVQYLHSLRIMYRDLKPDNVGFDSNGTVMLFDFGLAKTLPLHAETEDSLFNLTGNTGSLRYMSPEVALNLPYDLRADTYSFGILFWQICALSVPFAGYSCRMHAEYVVRQGYRPKIDKSWPSAWATLICDCWSGNLDVRPSFDRIVAILEDEIQCLEDSDMDHLVIKPRKTKNIKVRGADRKALDMKTRLSNAVFGNDVVGRQKKNGNAYDHSTENELNIV